MEENNLELYLREREKRDVDLRFEPSPLADKVTVLTYFWRTQSDYPDKFRWHRVAILETWRHCGLLKTVVVTNIFHDCLRKMAEEFAPWIEVQVEPRMIPGDINALSEDCVCNLSRRFTTPYVLTVQDDGFPLRKGLAEFVNLKVDFIGAPFARPMKWVSLISRLAHYAPMNGGFSLRSRRLCQEVENLRKQMGAITWEPDFGEDIFITKYLVNRSLRFRMGTRFAVPSDAIHFSFDGSVGVNFVNELPFGFHGAHGFALLHGKFCEGITIKLTNNAVRPVQWFNG